MTMGARTPGPWIYQYNPYTSQDGNEIPAFEVHGEEKVCDTNEDRPCEEQEANARLITAAPDLLRAAEKALQALRYNYDKYNEGEWHNTDEREAYTALREALTKATGT